MAYSYANYTGDGSTSTFAVPFPYIYQTDVSVTANGIPLSVTWNSASVVAVSPTPAAGAFVQVRRNTQASSLLATFSFGALLSSALNLVLNQLLYLIQEAIDARVSPIVIGQGGSSLVTAQTIILPPSPNAPGGAYLEYADVYYNCGVVNSIYQAAGSDLIYDGPTSSSTFTQQVSGSVVRFYPVLGGWRATPVSLGA